MVMIGRKHISEAKSIAGFSKYKVFNDGSIFSLFISDFITPTPNQEGYLRINAYDDFGGSTTVRIHRWVALLFVENPNPLKFNQVNHKDGNKSNAHFSNLEWVDNSENQKHAYASGLQPSRVGISNGRSLLNEAEVIEMRRLSSLGVTNGDLSKLFKVSNGQVWNIVNYKNWKSL
jgi:hypothetical protein